jgi:hypothetical protein
VVPKTYSGLEAHLPGDRAIQVSYSRSRIPGASPPQVRPAEALAVTTAVDREIRPVLATALPEAHTRDSPSSEPSSDEESDCVSTALARTNSSTSEGRYLTFLHRPGNGHFNGPPIATLTGVGSDCTGSARARSAYATPITQVASIPRVPLTPCQRDICVRCADVASLRVGPPTSWWQGHRGAAVSIVSPSADPTRRTAPAFPTRQYLLICFAVQWCQTV